MRKKTPRHPHRYLNHSERLLCTVCGQEAPKTNILDSSLCRGGFTKNEILEYYKMTMEQAKSFFIYKVLNRKARG